MAVLTVAAIEMSQGRNNKLYTFVVDGKLVPKFASITRIARSQDDGRILGYQRPEVSSHISEIRQYLESKDPMVPNALVIAFDSRVQFIPTEGPGIDSDSRTGVLHIPIVHGKEQELPGWIVDGQQRTAAIREASIDRFPIFVTAFVTANISEQREQFILVNSTKPLPKGLLYELIPETTGKLPSSLQRRRFPAELLGRLDRDNTSPFFGRIKLPTNPSGFIKDTSVLGMLENSLSDGALYVHRDPATGRGDIDVMLGILRNYWNAVSKVFHDAWDLPPRRSRLSHGAGIVGMGFLMDAIHDRYYGEGEVTEERYVEELETIKPICRWTNGFWDMGAGQQRKWDDIQNTSRDKQILASYLLGEYRRRTR